MFLCLPAACSSSPFHVALPRRSLIRCLPAEGSACGEFWTQGYGQLTAIGESQLRSLGGILRARYSRLLPWGLPASYSREHVYVRSTDYDRTLQSVMSLLQGMFAPGTGMKLAGGAFALDAGVAVPPVHTVELANDFILRAFSGDTCSAWPDMVHAEQEQFAHEFAQHMAASQNVTTALGTAVGMPDLSYDQLGSVADSLLCMRAHGRTWPQGITEAMYTAAHAEAQWQVFNLYRLLPQRQAAGGAALAMLAARLTAAASPGGVQPQYEPNTFPSPAGVQLRGPPLAVYSAHDTTLLTVLYALLGPQQVLANPPYASSVVVELVNATFAGGSVTPAVRMWYNRGIGTADSGGHSPPFAAGNLLALPGCANVGTGGDVLCALDDWLRGTAAVAQADVAALCSGSGGGSDAAGSNKLGPGAVAAIVLGGMLGLMLVVVIVAFAVMGRSGNAALKGAYGPLDTPPPHHD